MFGCHVAIQKIIVRAEEKLEVEAEQRLKQAIAIADELAKPVSSIKKRLDVMARRAALRGTFAQTDAARIELEAKRRMRAFPSALKLRLLRPGGYQYDPNDQPPLSLASVTLLKRAEESAEGLGAEVHSFPGEGAHIALVSRVIDAEGALLGLLHLSLPLTILDSSLSVDADHYVEVRQNSEAGWLILSKFGKQPKIDADPIIVGLPGTRWNATIFDMTPIDLVGRKANKFLADDFSLWLVVAVVMALFVGLFGLIYYRRRSKLISAYDVTLHI